MQHLTFCTGRGNHPRDQAVVKMKTMTKRNVERAVIEAVKVVAAEIAELQIVAEIEEVAAEIVEVEVATEEVEIDTREATEEAVIEGNLFLNLLNLCGVSERTKQSHYRTRVLEILMCS